jgi:sec-independent protein translocase protein TatA
MPFGELDPPKLILLLAIALLFLGPKRLPDAGHALGRGIRECKDGLAGNSDALPSEREQASTLPSQPYTPPAAYHLPSANPPPSPG